MSDSTIPLPASDERQAEANAEMARGLSAAVREAVLREHRSLIPAVIFDARPH